MSVKPVVRYEKKGHAAFVTLDRPEVLNAMNLRMHTELAEVWDDVEDDDEVWAVVLTGEGDRAFSVGQDLKELAARDRVGNGGPATFGSRDKPGWPRLTERFQMAKPIIAKVDGYALGGGFEIALSCDVIVAADRATFGLPEARFGLMSGAGGVFRLTRQIPYKAAMGHLVTGRTMTAARAYELGLVNEVVPAEQLDFSTQKWLDDVLRCAPLAVRAVKEAAAASAHLPLNQAFVTRYAWEERRMHSEDAVEGPRAYTERREPRWTGR
ncbi:enoyl-CoA-hydratase DpgD [Nocardia sp. NPDC051570]|uniref:enoyl-CoA-hydratase DpgD n=1 Tax=Nocardia sp. NPDC051570 TaxID=3364324 RepID=UPI0037A49C09